LAEIGAVGKRMCYRISQSVYRDRMISNQVLIYQGADR
jgi:hypothetical protein